MEDLTKDDRDRLERYLEWERGIRRQERLRRRRYLSGAVVAAVTMIVLAAWIIQRMGNGDERVAAVAQAPAPAAIESRPPVTMTEPVPAPAVEGTPPAATGSVPPAPNVERAPPVVMTPPAPATPITPRAETSRPVARARVTGAGRDGRSRNEATGSRVAARPRTSPQAPRSLPAAPSAAAPARIEVTPDAPPTPSSREVPATSVEPSPPMVTAPAPPSPPVIAAPPSAPAPAAPSSAPTTGAPTASAPPTVAAPPSPPAAVAPPPPVAAVAPPPPSPPAASPAAPAPPRATATADPDDRMETLKRWVGYIPEVRLGKAIYRWVKSQPPAGPLPPPDPGPQAR